MANTHYIVQSAAAKMPTSCWGIYGRVAVLEVDARLKGVSMISTHAIGCHKVVATWERLNIGITNRCALRKGLVEAEQMAKNLNAKLEDKS